MDSTTEPASADKDKFVFWPLISALGALFLLGLFRPWLDGGPPYLAPFAFNGMLLIVATGLAIGFVCFWAGAYAASVKMWRWAASMMMFPAVIVVTFLYPLSILLPFFSLGDYIFHVGGERLFRGRTKRRPAHCRGSPGRLRSPHSACRCSGGRLAPILKELQAAGARSLRAIAAGLNARGVATPRGVGECFTRP